ncbi:MAG TPA: hypothetical protein DGG95_02960, partial [Cytophagales bacterium]|nr:hypothetical protein [Cytophagales bacterium]
ENINPIQCMIGLGPGNGNRMPDDLVLRSKNGKELPIGESSLSPLLDASGQSLGLILVFKDLTEKKEHEKLLHEMDLQRKRALIEGQEKERERIAKDIHDGLGQMLNAIKMNVSLVIPNPSDAANLSRLLNEAIQESIRISENLLPAKLRDFDLATCLKSLCAQVSHSTHSNISFHTHGFQSPLCQSKKVNLYRIAQESVNNAIKHSKASSITVQLSENSQALRLSIEDDGTGLADKKIMRQSGIVNMRDRAEIMGGKFTIESDPHRGTLVIVEVPPDKMSINV